MTKTTMIKEAAEALLLDLDTYDVPAILQAHGKSKFKFPAMYDEVFYDIAKLKAACQGKELDEKEWFSASQES